MSTRSERIRQNTMTAKLGRWLPDIVGGIGESIIDLYTWRMLAPFITFAFCVAGWWAAAIVAMLAGIFVQLVIMERKP